MGTSRRELTANGQLSLPVAVRRRWGVTSVLVIDKGDYAIVRPLPSDPIGSVRGVHAGDGPTSEGARGSERADEGNRTR